MTPKEMAGKIVEAHENATATYRNGSASEYEMKKVGWTIDDRQKEGALLVCRAYLALVEEHEKVVSGTVGAIEDSMKARYIAVQQVEKMREALENIFSDPKVNAYTSVMEAKQALASMEWKL